MIPPNSILPTAISYPPLFPIHVPVPNLPFSHPDYPDTNYGGGGDPHADYLFGFLRKGEEGGGVRRGGVEVAELGTYRICYKMEMRIDTVGVKPGL